MCCVYTQIMLFALSAGLHPAWRTTWEEHNGRPWIFLGGSHAADYRLIPLTWAFIHLLYCMWRANKANWIDRTALEVKNSIASEKPQHSSVSLLSHWSVKNQAVRWKMYFPASMQGYDSFLPAYAKEHSLRSPNFNLHGRFRGGFCNLATISAREKEMRSSAQAHLVPSCKVLETWRTSGKWLPTRIEFGGDASVPLLFCRWILFSFFFVVFLLIHFACHVMICPLQLLFLTLLTSHN